MRFFNTAGPCRPERHYMLPPERRLPSLGQLVEREHYFVIHAPRQSGKTTLVRAVVEKLNAEGRVVAVHATCETGQTARGDIDRGVRAVLRAIDQETHFLPEELRPEPIEKMAYVEAEGLLREYLARWSRKCPKPVALFLDEIDALLDDSLLSVLRQLRAGYPSRPRQFPAAVALIGLRAAALGMKVEVLRLRDFSREEVRELLIQHSVETGKLFPAGTAGAVWDLTRGQPWLVNALLQEVLAVGNCSDPMGAELVEEAKRKLLTGRSSSLEALIGDVADVSRRRVVECVLDGRVPPAAVLDSDIAQIQESGLITAGARGLEIANPIYHEILTRALAVHGQNSA